MRFIVIVQSVVGIHKVTNHLKGFFASIIVGAPEVGLSGFPIVVRHWRVDLSSFYAEAILVEKGYFEEVNISKNEVNKDKSAKEDEMGSKKVFKEEEKSVKRIKQRSETD